MEPTHAIYFKDNWDGEGDKYWMLAALVDGVFYTEAGAPVIKYEGDEVLKAMPLDDADAMAAIEAAERAAHNNAIDQAVEKLQEVPQTVHLSAVRSLKFKV